MIILDLDATEHPQYERLENYFGQPFIFNMLDNFGGNLGLYGRVQDVIRGPVQARQRAPNMVGTGLTPEGIFTNYVMYDLMCEMGWSTADMITIETIDDWFTMFGTRRYGLDSEQAVAGLILLSHTVYNCTVANYHDHNILMTNIPTLHATDYTWYSLHTIVASLQLLLQSSLSLAIIPTYQYDVADLTRQYLVNLAPVFYTRAVAGYHLGQPEIVAENKLLFLELTQDLDTVLSTQAGLLYGRWLESAGRMADDPEEKRLYELNACNQVTLWGPDGQILDYGAKQWAGLVSHYYARRWELFFDTLILNIVQGRIIIEEDTFLLIITGQSFSQEEFFQDFLETIGRQFCTNNTKQFPVEPSGDIVYLSREILQKWNTFDNS